MRGAFQVKNGFVILLFLMLAVRTSMSQPIINSSQLVRTQTSILNLYRNFRSNMSQINLGLLLDLDLFERTLDVISYVRGWSHNASEELSNVEAARNTLRSGVLAYFIEFINGQYDAHCATGDIDAYATLQASEIFEISSNWQWTTLPSDAAACYELLEFMRLRLRVKPVNWPPYVQLSQSRIISTRFYEHLTYWPILCIAAPIPHDPATNLFNEIRMLIHAQKIVIEWYKQRNRPSILLRIFHQNIEFLNSLQNISRIVMRNEGQSSEEKFTNFLLLVVLRRCIKFMSGEYERHTCHPAHYRYRYTLSVNDTLPPLRNYLALNVADSRLSTILTTIMTENLPMRSFSRHLNDLSLQVAYVFYENELTLRVFPACSPNNS